MARLSTIVGSILRDMVNAQHQANLYATTLKSMYSPKGQLDEFPLPAVALGEMELCIQYGITGLLPETELCEINPLAFQAVTKNISKACAQLLLDSAIPAFSSVMRNDISEDAQALAALTRDTEKWREISAFLSHKIQEAIQKEATAIVNENGSIDQTALSQIVQNVGEEFLLNHQEIWEILDKNANADYDEKVKAAMKATVEQGLPALLQGVDVRCQHPIPPVDVCVSSEELATLPSSAIHTFRLKISPHNINMYLRDE